MLDNLVDRTIEKIVAHPETIKRLLCAAERNIADSKIKALSLENRFDTA